MKKAILAAIAVLFLWFLAHSAAICIDGFTDENVAADLAVVFGNKVLTTGQPSPRLQSRLDAAESLYRRNLIQKILVSGGVGKEGFDEALVMRSALVSKGIPESDILVDQQGYTSQATARATRSLLTSKGWHSAVAVTQFHHISRAKLALRRAGITKVTGAHARYFEPRDLYSICREFPAWYKYLVQ